MDQQHMSLSWLCWKVVREVIPSSLAPLAPRAPPLPESRCWGGACTPAAPPGWRVAEDVRQGRPAAEWGGSAPSS